MKAYVIIGATGATGSAVAERLHKDGAQLLLGARGQADLEEMSTTLGASYRVTDASVFDDVSSLVDDCVKQFGRVDGIVNCAGSILIKPAHLTSIDEYRTTMSQNLDTAFNVVKVGSKAMMSGGGSIVLCSSAAARVGIPNHEAIAAAKAGIIGLTQSAAATYARWDIRVNCVAPGLVKSRMSAHIFQNDRAREQSEALHALGRLGSPDDVAQAIVWLLDGDRSGWVTGQVIGIDGGLGTLLARR